MSGLIFPDTRVCLEALLADTVHLGQKVSVWWWLQADTLQQSENIPVIVLDPPRGTEGYIDRVDRIRIECYAPGQQAVNVLESVKALLVGENIDVGEYYLDSISVVAAPEDQPYPSDTLNQAAATFDVVSRPITIPITEGA
jgi:hypothetical protein